MTRLKSVDKLFRNTNFIIIGLLVVIFLEFIIFFVINTVETQPNVPVTPIKELANKIIGLCDSSLNHTSCYDKEIPKLMPSISMEEAFAVTKLVQDADPTYRYCHVLGHELSAAEVRKNPADWKNVVTRCPKGLCSNGCMHGSFQEKFREEVVDPTQLQSIKPELLDLCESRGNWKPTGAEQASCYHGLGHMGMFITNGEINQAMSLCNYLALRADGKDYRKLCYDGLFMQLFQPLEPEDKILAEGKVPDQAHVRQFCGKFPKEAKASCLSESWPLFREEVQTPDGTVRFCKLQDSDDIQRCYDVMYNIRATSLEFNKDKISGFCMAMPEEQIGRCLASSANRMIEVDYRNINDAIALCAANKAVDIKEECFQELADMAEYNLSHNSPEFYDLCNHLPDRWRSICLTGK